MAVYKKLTLRVDNDAWERAKARAREEGSTLSKVVQQAVEAYGRQYGRSVLVTQVPSRFRADLGE